MLDSSARSIVFIAQAEHCRLDKLLIKPSHSKCKAGPSICHGRARRRVKHAMSHVAQHFNRFHALPRLSVKAVKALPNALRLGFSRIMHLRAST